jgi:integrase/recombinase XerD
MALKSEFERSTWPTPTEGAVLRKGGRRRRVLIDVAGLVVQLLAYLRYTGYRHGPLFRAEKNGPGGPLRYESAHEHWVRYCAAAGVDTTLHQLRHTTRRSSSTLA